MTDPDVLVVGSGPSGALAALSLLEGGARVTMVDRGEDGSGAPDVPRAAFAALRREDTEQLRYLLGPNGEAIPFSAHSAVAQVTAPRRYVFETRAETDFVAVTSPALGGLGQAWGAGVFPFRAPELAGLGLLEDELRPHYEAVAAEVGVAGALDDALASFYGPLEQREPPVRLDPAAARILSRARPIRDFALGRTWLAATTRPRTGRGVPEYRDLDFYEDHDRSVYRPRYTIEALRKHPRFRYLGGRTARVFVEHENGVELRAEHAGREERLRARALLLAAGTLDSAAIVLRSSAPAASLPLVVNPHCYVPLFSPGNAGLPAYGPRHSLAQLTAIWTRPGETAPAIQAQLYGYRSLLHFRLLPELPLSMRAGLRLLPELAPFLALLVVQTPDAPAPDKQLRLSGDQLAIRYQRPEAEQERDRQALRALLAFFVRLGLFPLARHPGRPGSSIHYAGTLPISVRPAPLTCAPDGRLHGQRAVYLADGSLFRALPSKGLTFTLMALAHRVGRLLARRLEHEAACVS